MNQIAAIDQLVRTIRRKARRAKDRLELRTKRLRQNLKPGPALAS